MKIHDLPKNDRPREPIDPHIRPTRVLTNAIEDSKVESTLDEIEMLMNPYLEKPSALFGIIIMASTLIVLLSLTAANPSNSPVSWATLPAALPMASRDVAFGWVHRHETRMILRQKGIESRQFPQAREQSREEQSRQVCEEAQTSAGPAETLSAMSQNQEVSTQQEQDCSVLVLQPALSPSATDCFSSAPSSERTRPGTCHSDTNLHLEQESQQKEPRSQQVKQEDHSQLDDQEPHPQEQLSQPVSPVPQVPKAPLATTDKNVLSLEIRGRLEGNNLGPQELEDGPRVSVQKGIVDEEKTAIRGADETVSQTKLTAGGTLISLTKYMQQRLQQIVPTVSVVVALLPFQLIPLAFPIFILVQSLASTGWITLFAEWWDSWVGRTGTVGSVAGMGFLSVILCNVSPTTLVPWSSL